MSSIVTFNFVTSSVRIVMIDDAPWFVGKDVCEALSIANHNDALGRLDDDERRGVAITDPLGIEQTAVAINESGLYSLILTSRKPEAKKFKKWVTSEVLPALRKTGRYEIPRPVAVPLLRTGQLEMLNQTAWCLAHPFYMHRATKDWMLGYVREYIGVNRIAHIPIARFNDAISFLESQKKPIDAYLRERIRNERVFLTQSLKRELDRRLEREGPEFTLTPSENNCR
ncbi:MAG: Bro-N domain-containing protein [Candidatus Competibacter denitrificans]